MKRSVLFAAGAAVMMAVAVVTGGQALAASRFLRSLEDDFTSPPQTARPLAWWHWIGYNVSSNGIVRDLTAMKESGLGGATCFTIDSQSGRRQRARGRQRRPSAPAHSRVRPEECSPSVAKPHLLCDLGLFRPQLAARAVRPDRPGAADRAVIA